jgi:hypothetical protein
LAPSATGPPPAGPAPLPPPGSARRGQRRSVSATTPGGKDAPQPRRKPMTARPLQRQSVFATSHGPAAATLPAGTGRRQQTELSARGADGARSQSPRYSPPPPAGGVAADGCRSTLPASLPVYLPPSMAGTPLTKNGKGAGSRSGTVSDRLPAPFLPGSAQTLRSPGRTSAPARSQAA